MVVYFILFIFIYYKNAKIFIKTFASFVPIFLVFFILSFDVANKLYLGWDAKFFYYIKSLYFFENKTFINLTEFEAHRYHPHFGSYIWAFFRKLSIVDFEYTGRLFYVFMLYFKTAKRKNNSVQKIIQNIVTKLNDRSKYCTNVKFFGITRVIGRLRLFPLRGFAERKERSGRQLVEPPKRVAQAGQKLYHGKSITVIGRFCFDQRHVGQRSKYFVRDHDPIVIGTWDWKGWGLWSRWVMWSRFGRSMRSMGSGGSGRPGRPRWSRWTIALEPIPTIVGVALATACWTNGSLRWRAWFRWARRARWCFAGSAS